MAAVLFIALLLVVVEAKSVEVESAQLIEKRSSVCYDKIGCFSTDGPFSDDRILSVLPKSPDDIQTKFKLFTKESPTTAQELDARNPETASTVWTNFASRPTKIVSHGFLNNPDSNPWLEEMKNELLKNGDYNVIIVNWSGGNLPPYTMATANTRVVGAQIALLIQELVKSEGVSVADFHIIGHSLGAHVAGYAGERIPGLGRITGLDPAGPYFDGTDITVRLDSTDAVFVDVIHSDAQSLLELGFGTRDVSGDVDFYPNLGHDQPGCTRSPIVNIEEYGLVQGLKEVVACNHYRSIKFFTESINTQCPFVAFPCASDDDFINNRCHQCGAAGCAPMGFNSKNNIPRDGTQVKYYLITADHAPFCEYHLDLSIKLSADQGQEERGSIQVVVHGTKGSTEAVNVVDPDDPIMFAPGTTYVYTVGAPTDIGTIQSVTITWDHDSELLDPSTWDLLHLRHPKLYVDEISVTNEEANTSVRFCVGGQSIETNDSLTASTTC